MMIDSQSTERKEEEERGPRISLPQQLMDTVYVCWCIRLTIEGSRVGQSNTWRSYPHSYVR